MNVSFNQRNIARIDIAVDDEIVLCESRKRINEYALEAKNPFLVMETQNMCDPHIHIMADDLQAIRIKEIVDKAIEETREKRARRDFILKTLENGTDDMKGENMHDVHGIHFRYTLEAYPQSYLNLIFFHNTDDMTIDENYLFRLLKNIRDATGDDLSEDHLNKAERFANEMIDKLQLQLKAKGE